MKSTIYAKTDASLRQEATAGLPPDRQPPDKDAPLREHPPSKPPERNDWPDRDAPRIEPREPWPEREERDRDDFDRQRL